MFLAFLRRIEDAGLGGKADRQAHATLPEGIPGHGTGHFALEDGFDGKLDAVDTGDRNLARPAIGAERLDRGETHAIIGCPDAADLVAELGEPGIGLFKSFGIGPVGNLEVEQFDSGIGLECLHEAGFPLDGGHVRLDAAKRDDAALTAHRLEQRLGHRLAIGHAAERNMRHIVRIEIPRMQVGGLVPLGDDISARCLAGIDDRPRIGAVVRVDVDSAIAARLGEDRLDVGNTLLAVAFGDQRHVFGAYRLRKRRTTSIPGCMIGVGQRTDRVDDGWHFGGMAAARNDGGKRPESADGCSPLQKAAALQRTLDPVGNYLIDHMLQSSQWQRRGRWRGDVCSVVLAGNDFRKVLFMVGMI